MSETPDDCAQMLGRVHAFLDHELDDADCDEIRRHLAACEQCLDDFDAESAIKQLVGRCCKGDPAPVGLRAAIIARLGR